MDKLKILSYNVNNDYRDIVLFDNIDLLDHFPILLSLFT